MKQVTAAIWLQGRKVFIAKRPRGDKLQNKWEFPGGKLEDGETPQACLQREMAEEFGIAVTVEDFFGRSVYKYESGQIELLAYFISYQSGELVMRAHDEIAWASVDELNSFDFAPADIPLVEQLQMYMIREGAR